MDEPLKLPELPQITAYHCGDWRLPERTVQLYVDATHTADQLRSYGLACARAALEEAAKVCESRFPSEVYDPEKGIEERAFADCAAAIRNLKVGE